MRVLIAPDKFKGSIDLISLCNQIRKEILFLYPDAKVSCYPLADGGDGFSDIIRYYFNTNSVITETVDPIGRPILAAYQMSVVDSLAYIEMDLASGFSLSETYISFSLATIVMSATVLLTVLLLSMILI